MPGMTCKPTQGNHQLIPDQLGPHLQNEPYMVDVNDDRLEFQPMPPTNFGTGYWGGAPGFPSGYGVPNPYGGGWLVFAFFMDGTYTITSSLTGAVVEQGHYT